MKFLSLKNLLYQHKDDILQRMIDRLSRLSWSPYQEFILRTDEGQQRLNIWVNLVAHLLEEDVEPFLMDQEQVGYYRAVQGFELDNVSQIYSIFQEVLWEILKEAVVRERLEQFNLYEEIWKLNKILFQGYKIIAKSWLKTREEQITEEVTHLQELFYFTREIIATFELEEIGNRILSKMTSLFGVETGFLAIFRDQRIQEIYSYPIRKQFNNVMSIMEKTLREGTSLFIDEGGDIHKEIDQFNLKRVVSIPIQVHGQCYGVLTLDNHSKGFKFRRKELEFLYQFINIISVALENAFILQEIEQNRQELHLLTNKMITIQEEERRRLAEDIHDTLAQALTGIGYKIQFCKELLKKNPKLLMEQLDVLIETVHHSIDQSRELISSLRPDLIDTMGLVPALKHYISNFEQETGIRVDAHLSKKLNLSSEVSICLFRVAQEALMNVYKHAETKSVEFVLQKEDGDVTLAVADNGRGLDTSQGAPWMKDQNKLGLLSMKKRVEAVGGTFAVKSEINQGFRIEAKVPITLGVSHNAKD